MSNLAQRIATAIVLVALLVTCLFFLPAPAAQILLSIMLLIATWEWSGLFPHVNFALRALFTAGVVVIATALLFGPGFASASASIVWPALLFWVAASFWLIFFKAKVSVIWWLLAGVCVLIPAYMAMLSLLSQPDGAWRVVWIFALVAAADIGAYVFGKSFGRRKLAPAISPGKTWEGLVGGLITAAVVGMLGALPLGFSPTGGLATACGIALLSVIGDLTVSAFKRHANLKDTGKLLPGHGGVLDRIDGLVAALPLFLLALTLLS